MTKGEVQIKVGKAQWKTIAGPFVNSSSGIWSPVYVDLRAYADSTIQIAFHFISDAGVSNISSGWYLDDITIDCLTGVSGRSFENDFTQSFTLHPNHPNPFNPSTTISYHLAKAGNVELTIYNFLGQEVRRLVDARQAAGHYTFNWDGKDQRGQQAPSGIYLYRLNAEGITQTRKMLLAQ